MVDYNNIILIWNILQLTAVLHRFCVTANFVSAIFYHCLFAICLLFTVNTCNLLWWEISINI